MERKLLVATIVILLGVLFLGLIRLFSGPEDNWICQKGEWVKHGNPSSPMPNAPCKDQLITPPIECTEKGISSVNSCENGSIKVNYFAPGGGFRIVDKKGGVISCAVVAPQYVNEKCKITCDEINLCPVSIVEGNSCQLLIEKKSGQVGCYGCVGNKCNVPPPGSWVPYSRENGKPGIMYGCFVNNSNCALAQ